MDRNDEAMFPNEERKEPLGWLEATWILRRRGGLGAAHLAEKKGERLEG